MRKINTAVLKAKGENEILMSSTNTIEGKKLEVLGLVRGASIYSKNLAKDIGQSLTENGAIKGKISFIDNISSL